ncbi:MAG: hypothetical protein FWD66_03335 [Paludibacter sp.]|nr:hypothetical protein [Paludibacter sp.]
MNKIKSFFKNNILTIIGVVIGGVGGFFYWLKIGCTSGSCPITSSPLMSSIWGMLMGGLILNLFEKRKQTPNENNNINN